MIERLHGGNEIAWGGLVTIDTGSVRSLIKCYCHMIVMGSMSCVLLSYIYLKKSAYSDCAIGVVLG